MGLLERLLGPSKIEANLQAELEIVTDFIALGEGTFEHRHKDLPAEERERRTQFALAYGHIKGWVEYEETPDE